ncbi:DUF1588 domain-containing protein [Lignipirellula cremea]|uniref:Planctomycete cytochrome C n=1 Tax=Lignipirellula cremea TaxID=2528010 RepID=A0A518E409_9BACT|nr:DUF1588 domain-containing protein [Lignipirellula cremea]QDU98822.1 hypothetical protein Pla8534_67330 [Lignipirellula cremea]
MTACKIVLLAIALLVAVEGNGKSEETAPVESTPPPFVASFVRSHCLSCHGSDAQEGDFDARPLLRDVIRSEETASSWRRVLEQVATGNMPPAEAPRPDLADVGRIVQVVRGELRASRNGRELGFPDKGNLLPHGVLFGKEPTNLAAATQARVWRISPHQYAALLSTLNGIRYKPVEAGTGTSLSKIRSLVAPLPLRGGEGLQDYSDLYQVDAAHTDQLLLNASVVARHILSGEGDKRLAQTLVPLSESKEKLSDKQIVLAVDAVSLTILDREPTDVERTRYSGFFRQSMNRFGNRAGLEDLLAAVLMSPQAVFRVELGEGSPDEQGRVRLTQHEEANAIAFALTDRPPGAQVRKLLQRGRFNSREYLEQLLTENTEENDRVLRFFREFFGYGGAPEVFKDEELLPPTMRNYLVSDTDHLVLRILERDQDVLKELLTTNESFVFVSSLRSNRFRELQTKGVSHPFDDKYRVNEAYNLAAEDWTVEQPLTLPKEHRAGILTQPSWLIAHSTNDGNHAIHRGKWIRERLLGGAIPDTPITVDAQLPNEPHSTLREKMRVTRESYCWQCHQRMDPLGLPFEMFDHWGRQRTEELGRPVDSAGAILVAPETGLEGPVDNAIELVHRLGRSEHVEQVFVRHAFRYWMGRNEEPHDAPTLQAAWKAYREHGGSMRALLRSLLTSDSFVYRTPQKSTPSHPDKD